MGGVLIVRAGAGPHAPPIAPQPPRFRCVPHTESMSYTNLTFDVADRIATITVNRPDKLNALNDATIAELGLAIDEANARADVAAVLLTGAGRAFVAGADISELASQSPLEAQQRARAGQRVFRRFETSPKPTIAVVNGFSLGGGCELAMSCHVRVASEKAKFGQPEVKLGIVPGFGGSQRLPRLVGRGAALKLLLTGEMIDAAEALRLGLADEVVPADQLMDRARALATSMIANAPLALAGCIDAVNRGLDSTLDEGCLAESDWFGVLSATEDVKEGMQAFLDKRAATFTGR